MNKGYYALRFRCGDALHARGDIQYVSQRVLHVGQTPECEMKLPQHSDYDDICYAVIVRNENGSSWRIIRQNRDAAIMLNGVSLALVQNLNDGDRLCFDRTELEFTVENGDAPAAQYVKYKAPVWIWSAFSVVFLFLAGILFNIYENSKTTLAIFGDEVESICMVEADTLLVLSVNNDTLDVIPANSGKGTGIQQILAYYHLSKEEALAFGDGNNDIEMLQSVGTGVAMENASAQLKAVADDVCGHVAEDGIYQYFLRQGMISHEMDPL